MASPTDINAQLAGYAPTSTVSGRSAASFTPTSTVAASLPDLGKYQSAYTDDVLSAALRNLDTQGAKARNQLGTDAFSAGAFGDARHGVESGMLDSELAKTAGDLTASVKGTAFDKAMGYLSNDVDRTNSNFVTGQQLLGQDVDRENANFNSGMSWLGSDIDRTTNAEFQNAQLDNQWFQNQLSAMGLGDSIYNNSLSNGMNYADALLGLDQYDRGINQDELNVKYDDWTTKQGWDSAKLNEFLGFINGTPSTSSTETSSPNNSWASLLGAALGNVQGSDGTRLFA